MNLLTTTRLTNKQIAIGVILIMPWYLYFAPTILNFLIQVYLVNFDNFLSLDLINIIYNILVGLVSAIPICIVFNNYIRENFQIFKNNLLENIIWVLTIGLLLSYGLSAFGEMIRQVLLPSGQQSTNQTLVETMLESNGLLMAFQAVIIAPFVEEMLFRGLIFNSLRQKNSLLAHLISAFLFGLLHVYTYILNGNMSEWIQLIPYMMTGLSLSYVYEKRQTIFASILLHAIKNLIAVILIVLI